MDFKDGLSWFAEKLYEATIGFMYKVASDFATEGIKLVFKFVTLDTNINEYINLKSYLSSFQYIALALLLLSIAWEGFKQQAGPAAFRTDEISVETLIMRTTFAAICIFFLPWSVENVFIKINNLLVKLINEGGVEIKPDGSIFTAITSIQNLTTIVVILMLIFFVSFFILGIIAGIRYIEIIYLILIAPFVAVSIVRSGDSLDVWIRETVAVVFTQAVHAFGIQLLANIIGKLDQHPIEAYILAIGCLAVILRGPQYLRRFLYNTGVGSAVTRSVGQAGRWAAYKYLFKSPKLVAA
ncbi:conjugal transfer protein TrbL family protein [Parageobacillus thermoglucosidasius]|jgi:hypothetical protein|uniref:Conjugal transfer protein TraL n=1 Tax=Parageobacillus thermoglucosidasius TaxID=1426 RepID=A0AB38R696_PARTM|nr:conjugal transfer protein TrbL family protein [Parageobacillus thermoglucosidasius]UOE78370.1 hypothetical protein IMI45_20250 [Parageobacillus thermoglucosidasius]